MFSMSSLPNGLASSRYKASGSGGGGGGRARRKVPLWGESAAADLRNSSAASRFSQALALLQHRLSMGVQGLCESSGPSIGSNRQPSRQESRVTGWGCTVWAWLPHQLEVRRHE